MPGPNTKEHPMTRTQQYVVGGLAGGAISLAAYVLSVVPAGGREVLLAAAVATAAWAYWREGHRS